MIALRDTAWNLLRTDLEVSVAVCTRTYLFLQCPLYCSEPIPELTGSVT